MTQPARTSEVLRTTGETSISLRLSLDGTGVSEVATGIGFFDHMLTLFAKHGAFDLEVHAKGDLHVDCHHTVEDTGLVLGQAFREAIGNKAGIQRYGYFYLPMDETLARVVVDFSGRPYLVYKAPERVEQIGEFSFQLVEEFMRALCVQAGLNLHIEILYGKDAHHMAEAIFKGTARALRMAVAADARMTGVPSTKGTLTE
jgi:imidazoleglycerol-phosphate dehydratase